MNEPKPRSRSKAAAAERKAMEKLRRKEERRGKGLFAFLMKAAG